MADSSRIEWTDASWNPTTGCTKISAGCKNCYAATLSKRLKAMGVKKYRNEFTFTEHPDQLDIPLKWGKPRKIFVNSMSDLFHEKATFEFVDRCFSTMLAADWHTYQILTKRPAKMAEYSERFYHNSGHKIPSHIWMGTSVENRDNVWRIRELRRVKSELRFISFEPLIGTVGTVNLKGVDWAIIGGESGYGFRPVQKEWITEIIKQCRKEGVKIFFKQWGGPHPKAGGRTINGRIYDEYPEIEKKALPILAR